MTSVTPNEIEFYGAADMPEADGATVGGAVDFAKKVGFYDISPAGALDLVSSSSSDTATKIQVMGRDGGGVIQTPAAATLTGTTLIAAAFSGQSFERLLAGVVSGGAIAGLSDPGGTAATGDVAALAHTRTIVNHVAQTGAANTSGTTPPLFKLAAGDGTTIGALTFGGLGLIVYIVSGTGAGQLRRIVVPYSAGAYGADVVAVNRDWGTLPDATSHYDVTQGFVFDIFPNQVKAITRLFATAAAEMPGGSSRTYYEKIFAVNNDTGAALTTAALEVVDESGALPGSVALDLALTTALNDTGTVADRQTAPAAGVGSFVTQPSAISVPAPGNLPAGAAPNSAGAQGMWLRLTLPAGTTAYKGAARLRATGSTI
jgi:hypothetical protein